MPSTAAEPAPTGPDRSVRTPRLGGRAVRPGDRVFAGLTRLAGGTVLAVMAGIAVFLVYRAVPALRANTANLLTTPTWLPDPGDPGERPRFGIAALLFHTLTTGVIAMVVAVPVAVGIALFITYYAPRPLSAGLGYLVELLAAVPSIVYGLWGFAFLARHMTGPVEWLDRYLGWTVVFDYRPDNTPNNYSDLTAGIVLAIMILPIVSSLSREVFGQVPRDHVEAALALGATRWEMIRTAVLPFGRAGVVSASILGLGRALGETLAVTLVLASTYSVNVHVTEQGGVTFASNIALKYNEAGEVGTGALIASGLCLFAITLAVNLVAQVVLRRGRRRVAR